MGILLEIHFLKQHYHGEMYPPAPATVFQALVAGGYAYNKEATQAILREMETWGPPTILCPGVSLPSRITAHSRDNVEAHKERVLYGQRKGRNPNQAIEKRCRVFQAEPQVHYFWNVPIEEVLLKQLQFIGTRLHRVGRGEDDAFARVSAVDELKVPQGWTKYEAMDGETNQREGYLTLTVPAPGSLQLIEWKYETQTSLKAGTLCPSQVYRSAEDVAKHYEAFVLKESESDRFLQCRFENLTHVTAWFRHAANVRMKKVLKGEAFTGYLGGHHSNKDLQNQRLAFLPLPSLGEFGNGGIRRFMLAEPRIRNQEYKGILSALAAKLSGPIERLDGDGLIEAIPVSHKEDSTLKQYVKSGRNWTTVTPVILHGHNIKNRKLNIVKTDAMLLKAFEMAGIPAGMMKEVAFHRTSQVPGVGDANRASLPENLGDFPRYHVSVKFKDAVKGPVLAGIGRHRGFGTFVCVD
jgi:CRISPR-associated protein Csb2